MDPQRPPDLLGDSSAAVRRRRRSSTVLAVLACAVLATTRPARAMQFDLVDVSPSEVMVGGRGPIVRGDAARLERALASVPPEKRLLGLALDSPGGTVVDGVELARMIRDRGLAVVVPSNSKCASACFLMLVAAPRRLAANDALVGVHGASDEGKETEVSMAMTTAMARAAAELGVPPTIIGKMVGTAPSRMEWLTPADLNAMGVVVYDDADAPTMARRAAPAGGPPARPSFRDGRLDRIAWEQWLAPLRGPYRDGALFWAIRRDLPQPGSCLGPNGASRGDFTLGCEEAKRRLAASDARLRASAEYRQGWNSEVPSEARAAQPARAEVEFEGAIFCGQEPTRLLLRLLPAADLAHRRAVYTLGPGRTGASVVEGRLDLAGGTIDLAPTMVAQRNDAIGPLGLQGRSDDGGRTFTGRVTANPRCTLFTLKRLG